MATLELNGKSLATQTSSDEPVIASTVTGGAGLSGMTSLGTVTVGNLANTAIVYPAGHVLQTLYVQKTTGSSSTTSTTFFYQTHGAARYVTHTPVGSEVRAILKRYLKQQ